MEKKGLIKIEELIEKSKTKSDKEREWRDNELKRTDSLTLLPDYPNMGKLLNYRNMLREYPSLEGFPNIERPRLNAGTKETILTKYQFLKRFYKEELQNLFTVKKSSVELEVWLEIFKISEVIDIELQETIDGVNSLENTNIIGVGRASEILT